MALSYPTFFCVSTDQGGRASGEALFRFGEHSLSVLSHDVLGAQRPEGGNKNGGQGVELAVAGAPAVG